MPEYDSKAIGNRIKQQRETLNLSQEFMTGKLPIQVRAYQSYENGETKIPLDNLMLICQELEVTPDYILGYRIETSNRRDHLIDEIKYMMDLMNEVDLTKLKEFLQIYGPFNHDNN